MRWIKLKLVCLSALVAISTSAQTNTPVATDAPGTNSRLAAAAQRAEQVRADCIHGRRQICGKILQILPGGLVVESGYTNLLREPLTRSWLVPGTVTASRADDLLEGGEPGSICIGTVFLTDLPKSRGRKPKQYDYVIIEGYPAGQCTYTSVGTLKKTVRRFSAQLTRAIEWNLQTKTSASPSASGEK